MEPQQQPDDPGQVLLKRASDLLTILRAQARRAFVLEFTGTPKAGKSTSVATLQTFFKGAGYQVHLLKERAADCPLPMKGHFFFNAWTMATMLAEVLETHETSVDLLILDRGFFDALIWLELQVRRGQVTAGEKRTFSEFILLERWRSLVDLTFIMKVSPEKALERENEKLIVPRTGGMMNPRALGEFNEVLALVRREYENRFPLIEIDTTETNGVVQTNIALLEKLLSRLENWADPCIAVLPRKIVTDTFGETPFLHGDEALPLFEQLATQIEFRKRSDAEKDKGVVQMIAAGVHAHGNRLMILERDARERKAKDYGRRTLWTGCHVDEQNAAPLVAAKDCLRRRIQQELHLSTELEMNFLGLAWDQDQQESQHFGVMFRVPVGDDYVAAHLENKQFKKMGRSGSMSSAFKTQEEILLEIQDLDLEPWSRHMLKNINLSQQENETP